MTAKQLLDTEGQNFRNQNESSFDTSFDSESVVTKSHSNTKDTLEISNTNHNLKFTNLYANLVDKDLDLKKLKINHLYLIHLAFCMAIGDMNLGCAIDTAGNLTDFIRAQILTEENFTRQEFILLSSFISFFSVFGVFIGSQIIRRRIETAPRRQLIIIACIVAIIGSALSVVKNIYVMMAGQFIFGLGGGASMFLCSTLLEEVVPAHVFDWGYGQSTIVAIAFIIFVQELFVLRLFPVTTPLAVPKEDGTSVNYDNLKEKNVWMTLLFIPMALNIYLIFALIFVHPNDSIDYNIKQGNQQRAKQEISRVYSNEATQIQEQILEQRAQTLASSGNTGASKSLYQVFTDPDTGACAQLAFVLGCARQGSGIYMILGSLEYMLPNLKKQLDQEDIMANSTIKIIIASANFFGAICAIFTILLMKYRILFVGGHSMMAIGLLICVISCKFTIYGVIVGLCIFCIAFQSSTGVGYYVYFPQVASSPQIVVFCGSFQMIILSIFQFASQYSANPAQGPFFMFLTFTIVQAVAAIYAFVYLKESKGLSGEEMKNLYKSKERVKVLKEIVRQSVIVGGRLTVKEGSQLEDRITFHRQSLIQALKKTKDFAQSNSQEDFNTK